MLQISRIGIIHRIKPPAVWSITLTTHFLSHPEGIANHTDPVNRLDDCLEPSAGAVEPHIDGYYVHNGTIAE